MERININEIKGFRIGQAQNVQAATGCTVIICEEGAVCGVDVRGGSPGTRDTDALNLYSIPVDLSALDKSQPGIKFSKRMLERIISGTLFFLAKK
jgi:hypothetical protein